MQPEIESPAAQAKARGHLAALRKLPSNEQRRRAIDQLERELGNPKQ